MQGFGAAAPPCDEAADAPQGQSTLTQRWLATPEEVKPTCPAAITASSCGARVICADPQAKVCISSRKQILAPGRIKSSAATGCDGIYWERRVGRINPGDEEVGT